MRPAAYCKYRFVVKSNYPVCFFRSLYEMYFRHTILCMTSDEMLRYVGVFCKGAKHWGGHLPPQNVFFNVNLSEFWGPENGCTFVILMFGVSWEGGGGHLPP
jgi:hypothetical protein